MIKPRFKAHVVNGVLRFTNPPVANAYLWKFKPTDDLYITIEKPRRQRTLSQNAWYWGGILPVIAHETGHTEEELHEIFKRLFLKRKVIKYRDKEFPVPGSTTDCDIAGFSEYIEHIRAEAAALGINVPDPEGFTA